jgi:hypothetical protein
MRTRLDGDSRCAVTIGVQIVLADVVVVAARGGLAAMDKPSSETVARRGPIFIV